MDIETKGAWLLSQSKNLDAVTGSGAAQFENIAYAGRIGRLYNLLRRNVRDDANQTIDAATVKHACNLNSIDRPTREAGLKVLQDAGRVDVSTNGHVNVLGATSKVVLEVTAKIFRSLNPSTEEEAVLDLSEKVAEKPLARDDAAEFIGDSHRLSRPQTSALIDLCKSTTIVDEETDRGHVILFNSNTFRDGKYARKAWLVLQGLTTDDSSRLSEVQEKLSRNGALYDVEVERMLGEKLHRRLISVGFFDRMEVSNYTEAVGYIASPKDFQKYGRPFEEDPIDDAKALIASLAYGQTRSNRYRGRITMPDELLRALIAGREVGGDSGVTAIGEDYKELEMRQVVRVIPKGHKRFTMKLLKADVAELALTIVRGGTAAQEAILLDGSAATSFKGPHEVRTEVRSKNTVNDKRFVTETLDRLRSGG